MKTINTTIVIGLRDDGELFGEVVVGEAGEGIVGVVGVVVVVDVGVEIVLV